MMPQVKFPKCKRGVFGLSSWEAQRKPSNTPTQGNRDPEAQVSPQNQETDTSQVSHPRQTPVVVNGHTEGSVPQTKKKENQVLAKYTYKSNPNSPLGKELDMKPGDRFTLKSDENEHWWLVESQDGQVGYVPSSYVVVHEVNALPWLAKKEEPELEDEAPKETTFGAGPMKARAYVSAYNRDQVKQEDGNRWRCDVCDKTLNGPKPYSAHMNSKSHKEEVEYAREQGRL